MKKIYLKGNYIIVEIDGTRIGEYASGFTQVSSAGSEFKMTETNRGGQYSIIKADSINWYNEAGDTAYTEATLETFLFANTGKSSESVEGTGAVDSVFGRTGIVTAQSGDYDAFYLGLDSVLPVFLSVKNATASTITKGSAVYITDVVSSSGKPEIELADSSDPAKMNSVGLVNADILANGEGNVVVSGTLTNFDTSAFDAGDTLYIGSAGAYSTTKPTGSNLVQNIGMVSRSHVTSGSITIIGSGRSNDIPNILEDNIWVGDSNGVPQVTTKDSFKQYESGTTAQRPSTPTNYLPYFDTDLGYAIVYNGSAWVPFSNQASPGDGGADIYYSFQPLTRFDSENANYVGLDLDSMIPHFGLNTDNWFIAIRFANMNNRDDSLQSLFTGNVSGCGLSWRPAGDYFGLNKTSSYLQACDNDTHAYPDTWIVYNWSGTQNAWVGGVKELNNQSASLTATPPTELSFLRSLYSSAYISNNTNAPSNIIIGTGNVLSDAEVALLTSDIYKWSDVDSAIQTKSTNAWSFSATGVVIDKGSIGLTPNYDDINGAGYQMVANVYQAPVPYLLDGVITVNNDTTGDFDLNSVLVNRGNVVVSFSKVSGPTWFGDPNSGTGILTVDANGQTAGDYSAVYRCTDPNSNTDDMTLTATVTAFAEIFGEDFESGIGSWVVLDDAATINQWELGTAVANGGSNSLYISDDGGTSNNYTGDAGITHAYHGFTTPADISGGVTLNFDWRCDGESSYDYLRVFIVPDTVTPVAGTEVLSSYNIAGVSGKYNVGSDTVFTSESVDISSLVAASTNYRIVLQWKNDGSGGSQPPAAVDNISIVS